jgi:hypothetical protein
VIGRGRGCLREYEVKSYRPLTLREEMGIRRSEHLKYRVTGYKIRKENAEKTVISIRRVHGI